jgi:endogenous inhibitor of DNA gyrase (YacG/DUF329 family)
MARIRCPNCRKTGDWPAGKWAPFCSEGKWLGEEHRIAGPLRPEHFAGYEDLPEGANLDQPEQEP